MEMGDIMEQVTQEMFKQWVLKQQLDPLLEIKEEDNAILLETECAKGKIRFYEMNIVELSAESKIDGESVFYLHFQLNTMEHAQELFHELCDCIIKVKKEEIHKILLSCTAGFTTAFFAEKLNEAFELLGLKYHVEAVFYEELFNVAEEYELICIAPQIGYKLNEIHQRLPHANAIKIPSNIFAKYDAGEMIKLIQTYIEKPVEAKIERPNAYRDLEHHDQPILCLNIIRNSRRTHIAYAIYDANNFVVQYDNVVKPKVYLSDIYDAIDICLVNYPDICCIGLSLPGIIHKDRFISANYVNGLNNHNLDELFTQKYHKPFIFSNDANAAAVGFYSTNTEYESISFIYQPLYYRAGIGSVVNGKLLTGAHNLSGELKLLPIELSKPFIELIKEPGGAIEIVTKQVIALMTTIDPEAIVICSSLIPDVNVIKDELLRYFGHEEYLPDLIRQERFHASLFLGQLILCIESIQK